MPLYLYECRECHKRFEASQPIAKRKVHDCPDCTGLGEQKLTPVAIDYTAMGKDPAFSTASDKWAKRHERAAKTGKL